MILMYHNIGERSAFNTIATAEFQKQMDYIKNSGKYSILSIDEYVNNLKNYDIDNPLTVTIDDGYKSLNTVVLPIIKKYEIPVSIYIPAGYTGSHNVWDTEIGYPLIDILNWSELREMSNEQLVTVGSHGINHISHGHLENDDDYNEIYKSKQLIEENLESEVRYYSYPYGQLRDIGQHTVRNLKKAGYKAALSTIWSKRNSQNNIYRLNRLEILGTDTLDQFISKLDSGYPLKYFRQLIKNILFNLKIRK
ncbi:MAG: polysaccharide deacetylase family protein [Candidatus Marinimicrobia bacterium]|jgi:peptidoglycan/xylan/chitin deacetylase (PgdA/CDA1 family)|nr:polysaccharide deacetylase family protein [Candidatus Neomarinimicrobiota bacterium]MBT3632805.1 polysaccharide deacetylase family protein [Candidatus Neomarinimicrobiota bacterium]MBT3681915.1 polysaccharide deacetylase family protein [Candidatus Neomarinimicrobiota bacterium]MBT3759056.1 polysaccharide deacetylase family protein [Candidatus Neomarinimicrobiota bacterium]MBT3895045.1 polysaccharide deacetylase family protein [Candidatus Neomarinimicrobiota bacterium]